VSKNNLGSKFDDFLEADGLLEEASAVATKRVIAFQLAAAMEAKGLTKSEMARRMSTSRASLERLLDPTNSSVTLQTLQSAARALGGKLRVKLDFGRRAA
jgi:antitoxin HicB